MNRLLICVCLVLSVCHLAGCCRAGNNHLDIILEGPWILYQDNQFDSQGKKIPVLVAIAPLAATVTSLNPQDKLHHHSPQMSTGDGFYVAKDFMKANHIFCVTFDSRCARPGPAALTTDGYPGSHLLTLPLSGAAGSWDWVAASTNQLALILPMPDSYSNDGLWHMHFTSSADEIHSIGLHLHYSDGPQKVALLGCSQNPAPAVGTCDKSILDSNQSDASALENSGTLRLTMRAPDNTDACDWHVRTAWTEINKILGLDPNGAYAQIDPAQKVDANGTPTYDIKDCKYPPTDYDLKGMASILDAKKSNSQQAPPPAMLPPTFFMDFAQNIAMVTEKLKNGEESVDWNSLQKLQEQSATLNPAFPRISQLQLVADLSRSSAGFIDALSKKPSNDKQLPRLLKALKDRQKILADDDDTKNGGDCRAPLILVK